MKSYTDKYHVYDIWCMVSTYNLKHETKYWDFEELSNDTGMSIGDFLWEMDA